MPLQTSVSLDHRQYTAVPLSDHADWWNNWVNIYVPNRPRWERSWLWSGGIRTPRKMLRSVSPISITPLVQILMRSKHILEKPSSIPIFVNLLISLPEYPYTAARTGFIDYNMTTIFCHCIGVVRVHRSHRLAMSNTWIKIFTVDWSTNDSSKYATPTHRMWSCNHIGRGHSDDSDWTSTILIIGGVTQMKGQ